MECSAAVMTAVKKVDAKAGLSAEMTVSMLVAMKDA